MREASDKPFDANEGYLGRILDDRYRLDKVIGAGAIGKIYAGTQLAVDRKVAIKLLNPSIRDRNLGKDRFLREAKAVGRLTHSSCLTLFDFGSDDELGCFYMVTEFVDGRTLADEMQHGELAVERVFHLLYQATAALQHAHKRGILHRDLKPENIMLVDDGGDLSTVKVLDFGLARIREEAATAEADGRGAPDEFSDSRLTHFGELNGTPAYMSPEQCRGELDLSPACDYYTLGVLAFELLESRLPYQSSVVQDLLSMHLNNPIPRLTEGRAPQPVADMIYRLLAKDPDHRLCDPEQILDTLRPYVVLEPSTELSMATRERASGQDVGPPDEFSGPGGPGSVALPGQPTLDNYEGAGRTAGPDTPGDDQRDTLSLDDTTDVSRTSAFGEPRAAGEVRPGEHQYLELDESLQPRTGWAVAAALVAAACFGGWWWMGTPEADPREVQRETVDTPTIDSLGQTGMDSLEPGGGDGPDSQASAADSKAVGAPEHDGQPVRPAAPTSPASRQQEPTTTRSSPPTPSRSANSPRGGDAGRSPTKADASGGSKTKRTRPRKLELTY